MPSWQVHVRLGHLSLVVLVLLGCGRKAKPLPPPPPPSDAGVRIVYQSGDPEAIRTPEELLRATSSLEWSVGLSHPIGLLNYVPVDTHPDYCKDGQKLLEKLSSDVAADPTTAPPCSAQLAGDKVELELKCTLEITGECPYVYRATIWSELDREKPGRYRLLATAWLQETVCAGPSKGNQAEADPNIAINITVGKKFRAVLDPCRQGEQP
jgi:hypothetical protein